MSRLIKKSIPLPPGVTVSVGAGSASVKGAKGELSVKLPVGADVSVNGEMITVAPSAGSASTAPAGTAWSLLRNATEGVSAGFSKVLEIEGVGFRAAIEGKDLVLYLGYALPIRMPIAPGATVAVEKSTITVSGIDKELVGRVAAEIRAFKKPEPYKGKGIHYRGEIIRRKVGKKAGTAS